MIFCNFMTTDSYILGHVVRKGACIKQANVGGVSCLLKHVCCHKMRKFMLMYYF